MFRVPFPFRLVRNRIRLAWRMTWRRFVPRPEEVAMQVLRAEQGRLAWDERCLAAAEYHWAILQVEPDARATAEPAGQEPS